MRGAGLAPLGGALAARAAVALEVALPAPGTAVAFAATNMHQSRCGVEVDGAQGQGPGDAEPSSPENDHQGPVAGACRPLVSGAKECPDVVRRQDLARQSFAPVLVRHAFASLPRSRASAPTRVYNGRCRCILKITTL